MNTYRKSQIPPHLLEFFEPAEIGLEPTPDEFVAKLVTVFREVRRVLRDDGTLWLNLGDSYAGYHGNKNATYNDAPSNKGGYFENQRKTLVNHCGIKNKDLIGIPWRVAFALQADGWYLRQDIIWHKPNPMPESVTDRCTKSHEYIFLLAKSPTYYCDMGAIKEPAVGQNEHDLTGPGYSAPGQSANTGNRGRGGKNAFRGQGHFRESDTGPANREGRNKRSVWTVSTKPYKGAHFATFPTELIEPCILAGAPAGGIVLDPFFGSGTTGQVAQALGRQFIGIELNEAYKPLQDERLRQPSLLLEAA